MGVESTCILHADADRFYFAVEAIERPELAYSDRPIIIGHDPRESPRAVVTTANDAARALGIDSGLSCRVALGRAPGAVFLPPRFDTYREYSQRLMAVLRAATTTFEPLSIDEAWLDWSAHGFDPKSALSLRARVLELTGLSVSVGVATSKLLAKMATEAAKWRPDRALVVLPGTEQHFLDPLPVESLWGVGPKTASRLRALGLETIGAVAAASPARLQEAFGPRHGQMLADHSRGLDRSELAPTRQPKSFSAEHTFQADVSDRAEIWRMIQRQSARLSERLTRRSLLAAEVAIKLRYADWEDLVRQARLSSPSADAEVIASGAASLIRRYWDRDRPVRLIGVRVSRFVEVGVPFQMEIPWAG